MLSESKETLLLNRISNLAKENEKLKEQVSQLNQKDFSLKIVKGGKTEFTINVERNREFSIKKGDYTIIISTAPEAL